MQKAIRWSPHSTPDRQSFLLLDFPDSSLTIHEVTGYGGSGIQHKQTASFAKLPPIQAIEWAPFDESLVGLGLSSGDPALLRIDDSSNEVTTIPIKYQRRCNSISFSSNGLIATGLDKVRNDFCLKIWDVKSGLPPTSPAPGSSARAAEPHRQLAMSDAISSVHFFRDQPECLVAGVSGKALRIYDLRESAVPTMQYPTTSVYKLSIDPFDQNYFISCATNQPIVCVWDRRMGPRSTAAGLSAQSSTAVTSGQDSAQMGASITYRKCIDTEKKNQNSHILNLRYSTTKAGSFGVLSSSGEMKTYDTKKEFHLPWPAERSEPLRTVHVREIEPPFSHAEVKINSRIESFDFIDTGYHTLRHRLITVRSSSSVEAITLAPPPPDISFGGKSNFMVGKIETAQSRAQDRKPKKDSNGTLEDQAVEAGTLDFSIVRPEPANKRTVGELIASVQDKLNEVTLAGRHRSGSDLRDGPDIIGRHDFRLGFKDILTLSISNIMRLRAEEGYRMDCARNVEICSYDPALQDMWIWIQGAQESAENNGMVSQRWDLSYLGVMDIWNANFGSNWESRCINTKSFPSSKQFSEMCRDINERCGRMQLGESKTRYPHQRQLCLAICGWALPVRQLMSKLSELEALGEHTKAAGWALFHGFTDEAIKILSRGGKEMKIMSTAVAGYLSHQQRLQSGLAGSPNGAVEINTTWKDLCQEISNELEDKYARAIFAYVSNGDWNDVVHEPSLPLRDRLGIALRFLGDGALTAYLKDLHASVIKSGDLEGIALTGLTEAIIPLLQSFINKTGDIQTPVLALSFVSPRYFSELEFDDWRSEYLARLQNWRCFHARGKYLIEHGRASRDRVGRYMGRRVPRQILVGCGWCKGSLALNQVNTQAPSVAGSDRGMSMPGGSGSGGGSGALPPSYDGTGSVPLDYHSGHGHMEVDSFGTRTSSSLQGATGGSGSGGFLSQAQASNSSLGPSGNSGGGGPPSHGLAPGAAPGAPGAVISSVQPNLCPHCKHALPRCAVCLLYLSQPSSHYTRTKDNAGAVAAARALSAKMHQQQSQAQASSTAQTPNLGPTTGAVDGRESIKPSQILIPEAKTMNGWFNFCVRCNHGYHQVHAREWFGRHNMCAVAGCGCVCDV
jgi:hypothetical protein